MKTSSRRLLQSISTGSIVDYNAELLEIIKQTEDDRVESYIDRIFSDNQLDHLTQMQKREIFDRCNSLSQVNRTLRGKDLETMMCVILDDAKIKYREQVNIDKNGIVIEKKKQECFRVDFVICPKGITIGSTINHDHIVLSCKRSLRERGNQESEIHHFPYKYYILTTTNEKPKNVTAEIFSTKNKKKNVDTLIRDLQEFQEKILSNPIDMK